MLWAQARGRYGHKRDQMIGMLVYRVSRGHYIYEVSDYMLNEKNGF